MAHDWLTSSLPSSWLSKVEQMATLIDFTNQAQGNSILVLWCCGAVQICLGMGLGRNAAIN
ncbi:hypothetical protein N7495_003837 [Penicillium taxi]|uniref:uncharacterized protein n=1 Tax=Penicillium taxi TaxID=168475 RepID=UPI00254530A5|nr:uncharacterized protein N7495_003837 [Penicillium taxi]KAJ5899093.1 hypothetical protein N7495_003837 [Penicillium taxi]